MKREKRDSRDEDQHSALIGPEPDVEQCLKELRQSVDGAQFYRGQQVRDFDTRYALWGGQSDDGRQWDKKLGKGKAWPWDGGSDVRVFYADALIGERVRIQLSALRRSRVQTTALRTRSAAASDMVTTLLTWMFYTHCEEMMMAQVELALNWKETYGACLMAVWWEETPRLVQQKVVMAKLIESAKAAHAQTGDPAMLQMADTLLDPLADEMAIAILRGLSPVVTLKGARKALKELRTKGETILPQVEVESSLPRWEALLPWINVFYPARTETIASARWVARRRWLNEAQLRSTAAANGWDPEWVEDVLEHGRGRSFDSDARTAARGVNGRNSTQVTRAQWEDPAELEHLVEVVWYHQLGVHEDYLLPCLYLTVFCPARCHNDAGDDLYAWHGPAPEEHGGYPYVEFVRERIDHAFSESRGVPQIAKGWQTEMKTERDQQINRASVTTLPPLVTAGQLGHTRLELGPAAQLSERKQGDMRWLSPPALGTDSAVVAQRIEREADRFFARISEHVPEQSWELALEDDAAKALLAVAQCMKLSLKLAQQYLPEVTAQRVAGDPNSVFHLERKDIQGQYDLRLVFSAADLDFAKAIEKLKAYKELVLAVDRVGAVDMHQFLAMAAKMLDRDMADQLIRPPQAAQQEQIGQVRDAWTAMVSGVEPAMPPVGGGTNYALQLEETMKLMQNPENVKRLQNPDTRYLFGRYVQHLQFGAKQQQNADVGRNGVKPVDFAEMQQR